MKSETTEPTAHELVVLVSHHAKCLSNYVDSIGTSADVSAVVARVERMVFLASAALTAAANEGTR
jgi:hypothetical protein